MKKLITLCAMFALTGCATTQDTQVTYAQGCAAYGAVFATALQLRKAGKLDAMQVSQVSLIDSQVTPLCTGPMPTDTTTATQQITAAVTALTIMEAAQ